MHITKKIKVCLCLIIGRNSNGNLHQQIMFHGITHSARDNIDIQWVLTFFQILTPFVSISFANLLNSNHLLGLLEKQVCKVGSKPLIMLTIDKCDKVWIARLVLWTIQWTPMECGAQLSKICQITHYLVLWNIETPSTPNVISLLPIKSFVIPPSCMKALHKDLNKIIGA